MLRRSDRYVLREMTGPFVLALAGLILFILLNIILSLSDLMVDRGISMPMLLRLVLLKVPSLLVVAVPMSVLFATFLGLGRMVHDREIVALESLGIPLRRILLPLVVAAAGVAVADFAVYNWLVPTSESAYQDALRGVIFRQGVPRITSNAFFKGANDQYIYIRRYDESTGKIYDVHIYDTTGKLFPQTSSEAKAQLTFLTADQGTWSGDAWSLDNARAYGFDREGSLVFSAVVATLVLPVDQGIAELLSRSKTTSEMGIGELLSRVAQARANGQRASEYLVEIHLKLALPLAAVIFVLLAGSLSLAFLPRSRAVGIVLGLLLVAVYQGVLWWTQTLGRRHAMDPALAAWLPDILFGGLGLLLFLRVDRLASRDVWSRIRAKIPFAILPLLALVVFAATARGAAPVHIECDELYVSDDATLLRARGDARATFDASALRADSLTLEQVQSDSWRLEAAGRVELAVDGKLTLVSESLVAEVDASSGAVLTRSAEAEGLDGSTSFTNSAGDETTLFFRARRGRLTFEDGRVSRIEAFASDLTTCACTGVDLTRQPYSLRADRLLLYPDRLLVAYGLTGRAGGVSVVWLPLFVQPLADALEAPLFPAIGNSEERGWFAKWSLPVFVSESLYGSVNIDVFTRYVEVGLGGVARYAFGGQTGEISAYRLPAKVGDSEARFALRHAARLAAGWSGTGRLSFEQKGTRERLSYSFTLDGETGLGDLSVAAARELRTSSSGETKVSERLPELALDFDAIRLDTAPLGAAPLGALRVEPRVTAGWLREGTLGASDARGVQGLGARVRRGRRVRARRSAHPAPSLRPGLALRRTGRTADAAHARAHSHLPMERPRSQLVEHVGRRREPARLRPIGRRARTALGARTHRHPRREALRQLQPRRRGGPDPRNAGMADCRGLDGVRRVRSRRRSIRRVRPARHVDGRRADSGVAAPARQDQPALRALVAHALVDSRTRWPSRCASTQTSHRSPCPAGSSMPSSRPRPAGG